MVVVHPVVMGEHSLAQRRLCLSVIRGRVLRLGGVFVEYQTQADHTVNRSGCFPSSSRASCRLGSGFLEAFADLWSDIGILISRNARSGTCTQAILKSQLKLARIRFEETHEHTDQA